LVYGKTGTSSRNMDALFVGLTENFVGTLWVGHDRPKSMPGVNGGGTPARAFSKLTDFYYLREAQARYVKDKHEQAAWKRWRPLAQPKPILSVMAAFATLALTYLALTPLRRHQRQRNEPAPSIGDAQAFQAEANLPNCA
jgi:penicillin-binding protein 1A